MFFRFLGSENHDTYFSNVQRGRILHEILSTAVFGKKKKGEVGIERLVEEGVFSAAFPLHDVIKIRIFLQRLN